MGRDAHRHLRGPPRDASGARGSARALEALAAGARPRRGGRAGADRPCGRTAPHAHRAAARRGRCMSGTVYLVGAGPGDPKLITLRGAEVLAEADVVVFDRLASPALLELAPANAERVYVGKEPGRSAMPQVDIEALLVERADQGQAVVR